MPTTHVTPESEEHLQEIANALLKAKKVVVVTGAGISTNSGIPDFRSENGLYSLIQAQFDNASKEADKMGQEEEVEAAMCSSPPLIDVIECAEDIDERPAKRRKLSLNKAEFVGQKPAGGQSSHQCRKVEQHEPATHFEAHNEGESGASQERLLTVEEYVPKHLPLSGQAKVIQGLWEDAVADMAPAKSVPGAGRGALEPTGEPPGVDGGSEPPGVGGTMAATSTSTTQRGGPTQQPSTPSSSAASPWSNRAEVEEVEGVYDGACSPRSSTHRNSDSNYSSEFDNPIHQLLSSSPLSSPPPILSDPFETACLTFCSQTFSRSSTRSASRLSTFDGTAEEETDGEDTEETQQTGASTPYLASQSSFNSSRTTLPNLKGKDLFDATIWADPVKTSVFYTFATTLKQKARDVEPTTSHRFLGILRDSHKLVRCYTQNIDRLEERVGFSTSLELGCGQRSRFSARAIKQARESQGGLPTGGPKGQGLLQAGQETRRGDEAAASRSVTDATTCEPGASVDPAECRVRGRVPTHDREGASSREDHLRGPNHAFSKSCSGDGKCTDSRSIYSRSIPFPERQLSQSQHPELLIPSELNPASGSGKEDKAGKGLGGNVEDLGDGRVGRGERCVGRAGAGQPIVASTKKPSDISSQQPGANARGGSSHSPSRPITTAPDDSPQCPTISPFPQPGQDHAHSSEPVSTSSTSPTLALPNRGVECVYLHGSLDCLRCFLCGRTTSWDADKESDTLAGNQPTCPHCAGATAAREERGKRALGVGKLRPDIVLYGEEHPQSHLISPIVQHDLSLGPDMLLILGTSLRVHGLKVLVKEFAKAAHSKGGKVVFVNFTKPPESVWSDVIDFWVQWDCDAWVLDLKSRKPALWLPPGTVDENEPKPKPKTKRTSSALSSSTITENDKEGEETVIVKVKRRSSGGGSSKRKSQGSRLSLGQKTEENPEPTANVSNKEEDEDEDSKISGEVVVAVPAAAPKLPSKSATKREPKLDWNAKRPASTREDKKCGAYLTYQILQDLEKITGLKRPPFQLPVSLVASRAQAPVVVKAPPKRRKKAAAPPQTPARAASPSPTAAPSSMAPPLHTSITAAVKTHPRKRKRKTIDGEEVILPGEERRRRQAARNPQPPPPTPRQPILLPLPRPSISPRDVSASFTVPDVLPALNNSSSPPPGSSPLKLQPLEPSPQSLGPSGLLLGGRRRPLFGLRYSDPLLGLTYSPPTPSWYRAESVGEEAARTLEMLQGGDGGR